MLLKDGHSTESGEFIDTPADGVGKKIHGGNFQKPGNSRNLVQNLSRAFSTYRKEDNTLLQPPHDEKTPSRITVAENITGGLWEDRRNVAEIIADEDNDTSSQTAENEATPQCNTDDEETPAQIIDGGMKTRDITPKPGSSSTEEMYTIPEWFLANCVTTAAQCKASQPLMRLTSSSEFSVQSAGNKTQNENSAHWDDGWAGFYLSKDACEAARDTILSLLAPARLAPQPAVLFHTDINGGRRFFRELMHHIAKELGMDLVTMDMATLQNLAWEFELQDASSSGLRSDIDSLNSPFTRYFTSSESTNSLHRSKKVWKTLLHAHSMKTAQDQPTEAEGDRGAVIVHMDCTEEEYSNNIYALMWTQLRRIVECSHTNADDVPIALVVTLKASNVMGHSLITSYMEEGQGLNLSKSQTQKVDPEHVTKLLKDQSWFDKPDNIKMVNSLRLGYVLKSRLPADISSIAICSFEEWREKLDPNTQLVEGSLWAEDKIFQIANQIIGRTFVNPEISVEDIHRILTRVDRMERIEQKKNQKSEETTSEKGSKGLTLKLEEVKQNCNVFENLLIDDVVNPEAIESTYDDVVILDSDAKETLETLFAISRLRSQTKAKLNFVTSQINQKGALLYGPPGTGKTHLARIVARSARHFMIPVDGRVITPCEVGEARKYISAAFSLAKKLSPCVIFMDEVDSLFRRRISSDHSWEQAVVTQFLIEMDKLGRDTKDSPFVLVASNRPMDLDDGLMRRLSKQIFVSLPSQTARAKMLGHFLQPEDTDPSVDIDILAERTAGFSGSDLQNLCADAGLNWAMEQDLSSLHELEKVEDDAEKPLERLRVRLTHAHFTKALQKIQPTVTATMLKDLEAYRDRGGTVPEKENRTRKKWKDLAAPHRKDRLVLPVIKPPKNAKNHIQRSIPYAPLPTATSIRILRLKPLKNESDLFEPIHFSMVVRDLDNDPDYFALSYTWGDPLAIYEGDDTATPEEWGAPAFDISCDGQPMSVATNLYTALVAIRWHFSKKRTTANWVPEEFTRCGGTPALDIWIDAVCINQADLQERSQQVTIMDRIYASARATVMWLGGEDSLMTLGATFFDVDLTQLTSRRQGTMLDIRDEASYEKVGMKPIPREVWAGLVGIFGRRYFKRAWVVQEWVRSRSAVMLCGLELIDPLKLVSRITFLHDLGWWSQIGAWVHVQQLGEHDEGALKKLPLEIPVLFTRSKTSIMPMSIMQSIMAVKVHLGHIDNDRRRQMGLSCIGGREEASHTLQNFRQTESTDPRDKVFAFLGILGDFQDPGSAIVKIKPDYARSAEEVYTHVAKAIISGPTGLGLLATKENSSDMKGLPSWVPNLSVSYHSMSNGAVPFAASISLPSLAVQFLPGNILCATGHRADTVVAVFKVDNMRKFEGLPDLLSHIPGRSEILQPHITTELRWWWDMYSNRKKPIQESLDGVEMQSTIQSRYEVLWRTLLLDMWENSYPAEPPKASSLLRALEDNADLTFRRLVLYDIEQSASFKEHMSQEMRDQSEWYMESEEMQAVRRLNSKMWVDYDRDEEISRLKSMKMVLIQFSSTFPLMDVTMKRFQYWDEYPRLLEEAHGALSDNQMEAWDTYMRSAFKLIGREWPQSKVQAGDWSGEWYQGNYLFATKKGRLGLAPGRVEAGDEVWLLPGVDVPILLRPTGKQGQFRLVGESYVHGMMFGHGSNLLDLEDVHIV